MNPCRPVPLATFTCITGVSGSGKSSLTIDTPQAGAARTLNNARVSWLRHLFADGGYRSGIIRCRSKGASTPSGVCKQP